MIFRLIKSLFKSAGTLIRRPGQTLIHFQCDGCMAQDWKEIDRGRIVGRITRSVYNGNPRGANCDYFVAMRPDGSTFEAYAPYCMAAEPYMQDRIDKNEKLTGKMVYLT